MGEACKREDGPDKEAMHLRRDESARLHSAFGWAGLAWVGLFASTVSKPAQVEASGNRADKRRALVALIAVLHPQNLCVGLLPFGCTNLMPVC